ncbi:hypothetical protein [Dyella nitratireducens]|uniref:hypothetical protein n=1 Tax=Dyella nitratireducens TaxID=1849580 RepID=UPI00166D826C|nr:hypothetical protein [Dyella nitratireducens]
MRRRKTAMRAVTRRHAAGHHVEAPGSSPASRGSSLDRVELTLDGLLALNSHTTFVTVPGMSMTPDTPAFTSTFKVRYMFQW